MWEGLQRRARRHPAWKVSPDDDGGGLGGGGSPPTWRAAFRAGTHVDAQWRRGRFRKIQHRAHSEYAQCVDMRGDVACSGSADHEVKLIGLPPRARRGAIARRPGGWQRVLGRCVGHEAAVTCCALLRLGDGDGDGDGDGFGFGFGGNDVPDRLVSSTATGEIKLWDISAVGLDPWEGTRDERDNARGDDGAAAAESAGVVVDARCVATKLLTTPETSQPHSQFFALRRSRAGSGGGAPDLFASAGDRPGAGVHVYDMSRFGAPVRRLRRVLLYYGPRTTPFAW